MLPISSKDRFRFQPGRKEDEPLKEGVRTYLLRPATGVDQARMRRDLAASDAQSVTPAMLRQLVTKIVEKEGAGPLVDLDDLTGQERPLILDGMAIEREQAMEFLHTFEGNLDNADDLTDEEKAEHKALGEKITALGEWAGRNFAEYRGLLARRNYYLETQYRIGARYLIDAIEENGVEQQLKRDRHGLIVEDVLNAMPAVEVFLAGAKALELTTVPEPQAKNSDSP